MILIVRRSLHGPNIYIKIKIKTTLEEEPNKAQKQRTLRCLSENKSGQAITPPHLRPEVNQYRSASS
jgi:hypothetical protein